MRRVEGESSDALAAQITERLRNPGLSADSKAFAPTNGGREEHGGDAGTGAY